MTVYPNFTGIAESDDITARLKTLAGGRVVEDMPDDQQLPKDKAGFVKPFLIVYYGSPIPAPHDRALGVGERGQPHVLPINVDCCGPDGDTCKRMMGSVMDLLLDFQPNHGNATPLKASGGYQYTRRASQTRPSIFVKGVSFVTTINLAPNQS